MTKKYTAWALCGEWWWVGEYLAVVDGGYIGYEDATPSKTHQTVLLRRLTVDLHEVRRYVKLNTLMTLRKIIDLS